MPIFYLEPKSGNVSAPNWAATSLKEGCWVIAESEADARKRVNLATSRLVSPVPAHSTRLPLHSPWTDRELTDCRPDNARPDIVAGEIRTNSGKTIPMMGDS
jgi:hypothetical protein